MQSSRGDIGYEVRHCQLEYIESSMYLYMPFMGSKATADMHRVACPSLERAPLMAPDGSVHSNALWLFPKE